jgi:two-component system NtrC family sensor kinase
MPIVLLDLRSPLLVRLPETVIERSAHLDAILEAVGGGAMLDALPIAVQVTDPGTSEVLAANRAFATLVGRSLEEIVGARHPYPWWWEGEAPRDYEHDPRFSRVYRLPGGEPVTVDIEMHPVVGPDGTTAAHLGVVIDTTETRRLERQLVQGGKLAAIGELAAGVAHEINNPLFAILGLTEFLLKEAEPGTKTHSRLELIQQTGLEIKEIVRALLDFARENAEERHVVPLQDVVEQTVELVRRTNAHKGIEIVHVHDGGDTCVSASPNQLKQIFLNLIANARQAMPDGGTIRIEVRRDGDDAVATVSDDGPGISEELLTRIFEPFFTTKRTTGGTGLGLSVSLGIAEAHGGSLTAESVQGRGGTFTVRLPLAHGDDA